MIEKKVLVAGRVRCPPSEGFSWVDRRFLREHAPHLSREGILLYFFLAAVSDREGLSYWKDASTAARLRLSAEQVVRAREELVAWDLVAHAAPLTQVLSLPVAAARPERAGGPERLGEVLRGLAEGRS